MKKIRRITALDIVLVAVLIAAAIAIMPFLRAHSPAMVVVYHFDEVVARYPLDNNKEFAVEGVEGPVRVRIRDKTVRVISSTCHNQICVHTPVISHAGSQIVCAPNRIMVVIEAENAKKDAHDAVTQ